VLPVPKFGPSLILGREAANEMTSFSQRVIPQVLLDAGYEFTHPTADDATTAELT